MGRSHDALRFENEAVRDIVTSVGQEVIDIISQKKPTETISSTHDKKYALNGNTQLAVYLACTGANIAATDTLTFKFYVRQQVNGIDKFLEIAQTSNYTVTTAGVTADKVSKIDLDDADDIIKNATHYSVATSAGIAMPANCHGVLFIGKHFAFGGGSGSGSGSGGGGSQVYFTNEILIQSGVTEVAGKVYNTYANFLAYVSTLPPVSKPSNSNPWVVQLPSGRFDELVTFIEGVSIRGRNTILHTVKSEFTADFTSGFSKESALANLSYIKDCVVERFDFSNSVLPTVIPIVPLFSCFVEDKNLSQNGAGIVIACGSQFNELNFQEDLSGNILIVAGFNCIFKGSKLPAMANIDHSSLLGCTMSGGEYSNCHIAVLSGALPSKFGGANKGRLKLSNSTVQDSDFLFNLTTNPSSKRLNVIAENSVFEDSRFFAGSVTPSDSDNFVFEQCTFKDCFGESYAGTSGRLNFVNCASIPYVDTMHYEILGFFDGNQIKNAFGVPEDSNEVINEIRSKIGFEMKMIEIPYTYLDTLEKFSATSMQTNYVIVECRNIVIEAYDGDYNNKVMVTVQDGGFPEVILDNADSDLFLTGIYSKNVRKNCVDGGGTIWLQFTDTPYTTPPTKGNGVIQVFYFEKVKP
jgi:Ca2+-binding RTX toxin-like protein